MTVARRLAIWLVFTCLALSIGIVTRRHAAAEPLASEALVSTFDAGIRNMVIRWDSRDTRSVAVRRQALFEFMYETYEASAWIPQSLFDANLVTQAVAGDMDTIVRDTDRPRTMARQSAGPGVRHGAQRRIGRAAAMDRQLSRLPHRGDRRRGLLRRRHQDLRRCLARGGAEAADHRTWRGRLRGTADYGVAQTRTAF